MQEKPVEPCWCGEKKAGEAKHRRVGEKGCDASIADRKAYDKEREKKRNRVRTAQARWKPGTPILVEEIEEL